MAERLRGPWPRWILLAVAVAVLVAFILAQRQSAQVSYAQAPAAADSIPEGSAGELSGATVPTAQQLTAMVKTNPVVRLPGSIATWDERPVRAAIGTADVRILVAPPGLAEDARDRLRQVDAATVRVLGTEVTGGAYQASADRASEWQRQFATGDVTGPLTTLIAALNHQPSPADPPALARRDPTPAELATVTGELRRAGHYTAPGASLTDFPGSTPAFGGTQPLYVALPQQPAGQPLVHYGPALAAAFPGRPVVVLYGSWIEYDGPAAAEFAEVATASFYGQFADRLSRYAYPQGNVLGAYLDRVTAIRYAGLFDRPLPYTPFDPLRVALPALPWIFAACALGFLVLSARAVLRPGRRALPGRSAVPGRLAGLTALAVEVSGLTDGPSAASLTRGITQLTAAREAFGERLPDKHVRGLLDAAEAELDTTAKLLGRPDYRPAMYLQGRLV
ncbi:hypothetical protein [Amycolatopsis australiensis]|uniref:DUF4350 domain-containing protein n=1 Tax=Amycolatopsis australiensis TaxID=546364 RepID=A0A1K1S7A7_9PSEU|nr:hypothetical protein [Amycolatopsis australiensis]SFW79948.1 hypothetical protein SAMN04489730_4874 [Amycolatopsis australiensis]